ncbi:hypothetical protein VTH06DRAFT_2877 [Thermothelomyces fergusii]
MAKALALAQPQAQAEGRAQAQAQPQPQPQPLDQQGPLLSEGPLAATEAPWDDPRGSDDSDGLETTGYPTPTESEDGEDLVLPAMPKHATF